MKEMLQNYRQNIAAHTHMTARSEGHCSDTTVKMFEEILDGLVKSADTPDLLFPREIMWLGGAPGAGKGTNTPFITSLRGITAEPVIMSDLFRTPEMRALIDQGFLIDDRAAVTLLLQMLLKPEYQTGVVVDGFPRTTVQAQIVRLLHDYMTEAHYRRADQGLATRRPIFRIVVLSVNESVSIFRQTTRGRRALDMNDKIRRGESSGAIEDVRKTDLDPESCRKRYRVYESETLAALGSLKTAFHYHFIDAGEAVATVQSRIEREMAYQSSLELEPDTHEVITVVPKATTLTNHVRQQLTARLDSAMQEDAAELRRAVEIIMDEVEPTIKQHAATGRLRQVLTSPFMSDAMAVLIMDVLLERGYRPLVWHEPHSVPVKIDLTTGDITCRDETMWCLEMEWDIPRIRAQGK